MNESIRRGEKKLEALEKKVAAARAPKRTPASSAPPPPNDSIASRIRPVSLDEGEAPLAAVPPPPPADPLEGRYAAVPKSEADILRQLLPNFDRRMASLRIARMPEDRSLELLPSPPSIEPSPSSGGGGGGSVPSAPAASSYRRPTPLEAMPELPDSPRELAEMKYAVSEQKRQEELAKRAEAWDEAVRRQFPSASTERLPLEPAPPPSIKVEPPGRRTFREDPEEVDVVPPQRVTKLPVIEEVPPPTTTPPIRPVTKLPVIESPPTLPPPPKTRKRVPLDNDELRPRPVIAPPPAPSLTRPPPEEPDSVRRPTVAGTLPLLPSPLPRLERDQELLPRLERDSTLPPTAPSASLVLLPSPPSEAPVVARAAASRLPLEPEAPGLRLLELASRALNTVGGVIAKATKRGRGPPRPPPPPPPAPAPEPEAPLGPRRLVRMRALLSPTGGPPREPPLAERLKDYAAGEEEAPAKRSRIVSE